MLERVIRSFAAGLVMGGSAFAADLAEIKERGVLRVAVANLSPFVISDGEGDLSGFEIDSTGALADHLGVDVEYVEKPFCELVDAVIDGEADIIASGFSNTEQRRRILDFSLPYHDTEYFVVVNKNVGKAARKTLNALNNEDTKIAYQEGGVSGMVARGDFSGSDLTPFSSFAEIISALQAGDVDGAVMFSPYQDIVLENKDPKYMVPHDFALTRTIEAFAMEKGADELRAALNSWVISLDLSGEWNRLEDKWFDAENAEIGVRPPYACPSVQPAG